MLTVRLTAPFFIVPTSTHQVCNCAALMSQSHLLAQLQGKPPSKSKTDISVVAVYFDRPITDAGKILGAIRMCKVAWHGIRS